MNNTSEEINQDDIKELVKAVKKYQDFPKQGILFYDIFSLHKDPKLNTKLFENSFKKISSECKKNKIEFNTIVGLESRGFIIGIMLANMFNVSFVPVRKQNKLPGMKAGALYTTEYSSDKMEVQIDSIDNDSKVLLVDDLIATGGTMKVGEKLIEECGGRVTCYFVVFEIEFLKGKSGLKNSDSLINLITI